MKLLVEEMQGPHPSYVVLAASFWSIQLVFPSLLPQDEMMGKQSYERFVDGAEN